MERSCFNNASYSLKAISFLHLSPIGTVSLCCSSISPRKAITSMAIQHTNWHLLVSASLWQNNVCHGPWHRFLWAPCTYFNSAFQNHSISREGHDGQKRRERAHLNFVKPRIQVADPFFHIKHVLTVLAYLLSLLLFALNLNMFSKLWFGM